MRKFFKYCLVIILLLALLLTAGFLIPRKWSSNKNCSQDSVSLVVGSNGYHTSFIVLVKSSCYDWTKEFPVAESYQYLEFGWGNQQFYMAKDFSLKATLRALFPSSAVMHVVYLDKEPERWFQSFKGKRISLCQDDYLALIQYIRTSFDLDADHKKIYLGEGLYGPSSFYKGKGSYHALETCNTWVAEGLREADVNTPLWAGTAPSIIWHLKEK